MSTEIAAPADELWRAVSDVTRIGEWSPETVKVSWRRGADGPAKGAKFRGWNRNGWHRWYTDCVVVESVPGREFTFDVSSVGLPVARWSYEFEPLEVGHTLVTERWTDRRDGLRGAPLRLLGGVVTGSADRRGRNEESMRITLERLKAAFEQA